MRHQIGGKKLNRSTKHRKSLIKTLLAQLVVNRHLTTTAAKSAVLKTAAEKMLNKAKDNSLHVQRQIISELGSESAAKKMYETAATIETKSGFIKTVRIGRRLGDNALMVRLELPKVEVSENKVEAKPEKKKTAKKETKKVK